MTTPNLGLTLPTPGGSTGTWGTTLNTALNGIDAAFEATTGHDHDGTDGGGPKLPPTSLSGLVATGLAVAVSGTGFLARSIAGGTGVSVTNGDGVAGNPTIALNVTGLTAETAIVDADEIPLYDLSATAVRKATRTNLLKRALVTSPRMAFEAKGSLAGAVSLDTSEYSYFAGTAVGNTTFSFANPPSAGLAYGFVLELTNGGAFTITWPASVDWPTGTAPTLSPSGVDVLVFLTRDGGTTWRGVLSMQDSR